MWVAPHPALRMLYVTMLHMSYVLCCSYKRCYPLSWNAPLATGNRPTNALYGPWTLVPRAACPYYICSHIPTHIKLSAGASVVARLRRLA